MIAEPSGPAWHSDRLPAHGPRVLLALRIIAAHERPYPQGCGRPLPLGAPQEWVGGGGLAGHEPPPLLWWTNILVLMEWDDRRARHAEVDRCATSSGLVRAISKGDDPVSYTHLTLPTNREV